MPGKGLFSQCACLLTDGQTTIDHLRVALEEKEFQIVKQAPPQKEWCFGGPTLVVAYLPEVNGYAAVDVVNRQWPDSMGDPKTEPKTFAAWGGGHFGPFAFPGGLARAGQHAYAWEPGRTIAEKHRGFVRIRISYGFGAKDSAPISPDDYDPLAEMLFLSKVVLALLKAPGVICYFNPNGEVLRDRAGFRETWNAHRKAKKIPLALWANVRFFHLSDKFSFMDTVGNGQLFGLDYRDVEAIFPSAKYDPNAIDFYLRNVTHYLLGLDREMKTGEEIDGPGETNLSWTIDVLKESANAPPRRVLRLYPKANRKAIKEALAAVGRS